MSMLSVLKREAKNTGAVALYLFICLGLLTNHSKLVLATYQIDSYPLLTTVLGTVALAKVVVLLDLTPLAMRLETRFPVWLATLYKTLFYCAVSAPVLILERIWHFHEEAGLWGRATELTWEHADHYRVLAKVLIVGFIFGCYHLYHGIDRRLGKGQVSHMILNRAG